MKIEKTHVSLALFCLLTMLVSAAVYFRSQELLKEKLKARIEGIVSTAVLSIDGDAVGQLENNSTTDSVALISVVEELRAIKDTNHDIRYVYVWSKVHSGSLVNFLADAEMLNPLDENLNGVIDDDEVPPGPGEVYDISDNPDVVIGFTRPYVINDFIEDRWGIFWSGYAPITNSKKEVIAVLGVDVEISDYFRTVQAMFAPLAILAFAFLLILSVQTVSLARVWKNRVMLLRELDRQKDELLSIVAHQLATPVTAMKWSAEELIERGENLTADQKDSANTIQQQAHQLNDLITMILDVSRIQLGKIPIKKKPVPLDEFFEEILQVIRLKAHERGVKLQVSLPVELPTASIDYRYTRMAVENLLSNAVKYTPKDGSVEFEVRIRSGRMRIRVKDTGCGIPVADQAKIFGKMFRASNVVGNIDGNGFGLYVAKGSTEAQGGSIGFTSEEGKGTEFWMELPMEG